MKVNDIMTTNVITVHIDDRLHKVKKLFDENKFHHLMVVNDNDELVSVISDRDYAKAIHPNIDMPSATVKDMASLNKRVHQIIKKDAVSVASESSLKQAISTFCEVNVSCLPVVDINNRPIGIISWRDLLQWLYGKFSI